MTMNKWVGILLTLILTASAVSLFTDSADANAGDSEENPLYWYNQTIILLPEVVAGEITDESTQALVPPDSLAIDWGDGNLEVKEVDGYVTKGSVEIVHTYAETGTYHITCTPQKSSEETSYSFTTYELWMEIMGAPSVYFYDGEEEILPGIVAANGINVGTYEDNYFTAIEKPADPVKEDYVFDCWTYNGEEFDFSTVITAPKVLQATWIEASSAITVNIDGTDTSASVGDRISDLTVPAKDGYTFTGWYSDSSCTVKYDDTTVLTDGMTVYAGWTQNSTPSAETVKITIDGKETVLDAGTTVSQIEKPTKDGYTFTGWYSDADCSAKVSDTTVVTAGMVLYPGFSKNTDTDQITITVDGKETTVSKNSKVSDVKIPEKDNAVFRGWFSDAEHTVPVSMDQKITEGLTLYPYYVEETVSVTPATADVGKKVSELAIPESDLKFEGWYLDEDCTKPVTEETIIVAGQTYYAKYDPMTVLVEADAADAGKKVSELEIPVSEYEFLGWFSDADCTVSVSDDAVVKAGTTYYAKFGQNIIDNPDKNNAQIYNILLIIVGIIVSLVGLRLHPAILVIGLAIIGVDVADYFGFIEVIR